MSKIHVTNQSESGSQITMLLVYLFSYLFKMNLTAFTLATIRKTYLESNRSETSYS